MAPAFPDMDSSQAGGITEIKGGKGNRMEKRRKPIAPVYRKKTTLQETGSDCKTTTPLNWGCADSQLLEEPTNRRGKEERHRQSKRLTSRNRPTWGGVKGRKEPVPHIER